MRTTSPARGSGAEKIALVLATAAFGGCPATPLVPSISAGPRSACLVASGTVRCWGTAPNGESGRDPSPPRSISGVSDARSVETGPLWDCVTNGDGTVRCWGGEPAIVGVDDAVAVASSAELSCVLHEDATVSCSRRDSPELQRMRGVSAVVRLVAGPDRTCALRSDGTVLCWGFDDMSGFEEEPPLAPDEGEIVDTFRVAPRSLRGPFTVPGLEDAIDVAAGRDFVCAVREGGRVVCFGGDLQDRLRLPVSADGARGLVVVDGVVDAVAIAAGSSHACALRANETVVCWGRLVGAAPPEGEGGAAVVAIAGLSGVVEIDAGGGSTCALGSDGGVWCWGENGSGQLGDGTTRDRGEPVRVRGLGDR